MNVTINGALPGNPESKIVDLELAMGIKLPEPYRRFLKEQNGGSPSPERFSTRDGKVESIVSEFLPLTDDRDDNLREEIEGITKAGQIPSNLIPIATTPADNRVVLSIAGSDVGKVYYWAWGEEPEQPTCSYRYIRLIADDFDQFLAALRD